MKMKKKNDSKLFNSSVCSHFTIHCFIHRGSRGRRLPVDHHRTNDALRHEVTENHSILMGQLNIPIQFPEATEELQTPVIMLTSQ